MKKFLSLVLTIMLIVSALPCVVMADTIRTYGSLHYSISNNKVTITDCNTSASGSLTIPSTIEGYPVTSIGNYAFSSCRNLTNITITNSVTSIGDYAFECCGSLTSITVDANNPNYCSIDGNLYSKDGKTLIQYAIGKSATSFTIPNSVTSIGERAFYGCSSLTSITIPNSVTSIGEYAFYGCSSLTSITIPNSVTSIGISAFSSCSNLTSITIPNSVTSIGDYAFSSCRKLTSITIPNSVTSIGGDAFNNTAYYNNSNNWENGVLYIGNHLIDAETSSTSYSVKEGTITIADSAFSDCSKLTSITVDVNNPNYCSIDGNLYSKDGKTLIQYARGKTATSFTIPNSVTSIGERAFYDCYNLTSITIPNSVSSIGAGAFEGCKSLTSITIPNSVTYIGNLAFYDTAYYKNSNNWENGLLYIGNHLIKANTDIASCSVKEGTITIADSAFYGCSYLKNVYFDGLNTQWREIVIGAGNNYLANCTVAYSAYLVEYSMSNNGVLPDYTQGNTIWETDKANVKKVIIEDGITNIGAYMFSGYSNLTDVFITKSVTSVGEGAFLQSGIKNISYMGTQSDFDKITIATKNKEFTKATVTCYGSTVVTSNITDCKLVDGVVNGKYAFSLAMDSFNMFTALYDGEDRLVKLSKAKCDVSSNGGNINIEVPDKDYIGNYKLKLMYWDKNNNLMPVGACNVAEIDGNLIVDEVLQSTHDYGNNLNETKTYTYNGTCTKLAVTFSANTNVEDDYDFIYIYDKNGSLIGTYTGSELADKTITVNGNTVKIKLVSDDENCYYGYKTDKIVVYK